MDSSVMVLILVLVYGFNMNSQAQHALSEICVYQPLCTARHQTRKDFP